jgi:hypothetical protein
MLAIVPIQNYVADVDASRAFYQGLGLHFQPEASFGVWAQLKADAGIVGVHDAAASKGRLPGTVELGFVTDEKPQRVIIARCTMRILDAAFVSRTLMASSFRFRNSISTRRGSLPRCSNPIDSIPSGRPLRGWLALRGLIEALSASMVDAKCHTRTFIRRRGRHYRSASYSARIANRLRNQSRSMSFS